LVFLSFTLLTCVQKEKKNEDTSNWDIISNWIETEERVPHYNTLYFADGQGYEFRNESSNKLLIPLTGGPDWFGNRVGEIGERLNWNPFVNWIMPLYEDYNFFVPEKFDWGRGTMPFWNIENREKYTFDNLIANYASIIREYLSQNEYDTIIIFGHSEGGIIAPELYFLLEDFNISAIVSSGAGGLVSPLDTFVSKIATKYVEENLPDKPFDYIYYPDMIHYPMTTRELITMRADIAAWLKEKGL